MAVPRVSGTTHRHGARLQTLGQNQLQPHAASSPAISLALSIKSHHCYCHHVTAPGRTVRIQESCCSVQRTVILPFPNFQNNPPTPTPHGLIPPPPAVPPRSPPPPPPPPQL
ncbi:unnamed protein product [Chondrus crispus]|uniref:Uncharacterized protein n=1 Tax=Chondrus crispus TaxID=2769 RepID=R7QBY4_CHOCR|nr:unnamed protein product [Chondrus crispus]CDF35987.1 unnamed protein product [Chondrus crispus]|eukprot:XP_005715806.1 unnamed protein product [Chondrus crispus]